MNILNFLADTASILSLLITIFVANKVITIDNSLRTNQTIRGDGNKQAGRDIR